MPVQTLCPHCKTPCLVNEEYFGTPLGCYNCGRSFVVPPMAAPLPAVPTAPPRPGKLDVGAATSVGKVRDRNEDSYLVQQLTWSHLDQRNDVALIVVADGMGGHEAGDQASGQVICTVGGALAPLLASAVNRTMPEASTSARTAAPGQPEDYSLLTSLGTFLRGFSNTATQQRTAIDTSPAALAGAINDALLEANRAVFHKAQNVPACKGMGATAAVALIWDGQVYIGHVGDCRVYLQRGQQLTQVTKDQTLIARMIEMGQIRPEQAASHPAKNEVTQAVGRRLTLEPARYELPLSRGDWLIVACDGLHAHLEPTTLQEVIGKANGSAAQLANQLVDLANQRGGSDNCTVIVVRSY
jgi:protein phosphatase